MVTDPHAFRPLETALTLMTTFERLYPGAARYRTDAYVAGIWGTAGVLPAVHAGRSVAAIEASWADDLTAFAGVRARYLLYD